MKHTLTLITALLLAPLVGLRGNDVPAAGYSRLWQLGNADSNTTGFALAPSYYGDYGPDGLFVVGKSDAARDWPYVHPGPEDDWAGSRVHTFRVAFALKSAATAGDARLIVGFADMHAQHPPHLKAVINGRSFLQSVPKGGGNDSIEGRMDKARPFRWAMEFPAGLLQAGDNEISITSVSGSWVLYDYLALETSAPLELATVSEALFKRLTPEPEKPVTVEISIDCGKKINTMRGGLGASWHAMETEIPYGVKHPVFTSYSHGGSGWGGYPLAEDEQAWQQIYRHASWLGLDWNRVEIEQRVYEPERDKFTFGNPEMRILYRILDWNQKNGADVFFQQMWCNTAWLAHPEFCDDPVGRVHSAPNDLDAFADGLATLMEHLIKKRGYTCIKWLCINNEPGASFSWWQAPPNKALDITPGLVAVRKALDKRGLNLPLSGPDTTSAFSASTKQKFAGMTCLGAYDVHDYGADFDFRTKGHIAGQEAAAAAWAERAHGEGRPLFLSEFGTMAYGWVPDKPGPSCPQSALAGSELVIRLANAGVDGFNRWSFLNRGDLDGQWQLVDTWDRQQKKLLTEFPPHPNSYFCLGLLSRFTAKFSAVLATQVSPASVVGWQRVFGAAFRSPQGNLTIAIVNDAPLDFPLKLSLTGAPPSSLFHRYRYTEAERDRADIKVNPQPVAGATAWKDTLPRNSLTIYSTYKLDHDKPGVIAD